MTITYTFPVCKMCGKTHGRVVREEWLRNSRRCDCQITKKHDAFAIISQMLYCSTSAEARRVSKTITLKNVLQKRKVTQPKRDPNNSMFLMDIISVNVDNDKLSDAEFRQFIRNSLPLTIAKT